MYEYHAMVLKVKDGDTIDVMIDLGLNTFSRKTIRLFGIDTPSVIKLVERSRGEAAKDRLIDLILGKQVIIKTHLDKTGKYGRLLGEIFVDDININQLLIEENHAHAYFGGKKEPWG